ncbi:hypothetical protein K432DRAFT_398573 [Lepidopterella palustris CBS 459.81]|uniref:Fungal-type protein kinase domain-containing protein n=1 Tax=Lepidopterella palustris CBS 459.81 TaxID=1314670 RepID=A0A8E2J945_9PEZI|nr:hypothetical protein K432DRAFT_398573 [Lepidopterella palustris CBS 459.81]
MTFGIAALALARFYGGTQVGWKLKSNPGLDTPSKAWLHLGRYSREVFATQIARQFVHEFTHCGSNMQLWEFARVRWIAPWLFDVNEVGLRFFSAVLDYLWRIEEQLGFDPTILELGGQWCIEVMSNNQKERLVMDNVMKRAPRIVMRMNPRCCLLQSKAFDDAFEHTWKRCTQVLALEEEVIQMYQRTANTQKAHLF